MIKIQKFYIFKIFWIFFTENFTNICFINKNNIILNNILITITSFSNNKKTNINIFILMHLHCTYNNILPKNSQAHTLIKPNL